ncbi:hypothetical protein [Endozoicomonas sp. GU-1]|uniref:hypothetical protein n=1 Tax=Endozoicomonas sp. GU-1 TaxID=3009078 RepID=UPI0022B40D40|nr:hypothetical protein [Endozoicomonas sp. GU-1]WBA84688.1 hypothetical protein O3276_15520 [Endozoicomonas sp. GU-1]
MTTTMKLPGKTLPGILHPEITLKPLSANTLLINDATTSLHLSISGSDRLVISPANSSDLQDRIPDHLMAAGWIICMQIIQCWNKFTCPP